MLCYVIHRLAEEDAFMTDKSQLEKFKEAAREAECDMDEEKFDQALKKVAKQPRGEDAQERENPKGAKPPRK